MYFPQRCQLFVFAILIGLAALVIPYAASASLPARAGEPAPYYMTR